MFYPIFAARKFLPVNYNNIRMLEKLKKKWKVSGTQLLLIFCVFAITGTATAYISKAITG